MQAQNDLAIETELEALVNESELMLKKKLQMEKFLQNNASSKDQTDHTQFATERQTQRAQIQAILAELERDKKENPAVLEFFYLFEEMQTHFDESVAKETKLGRTLREVATGESDQKSC